MSSDTHTAPAAPPPDAPVLEARGLTKHFPVRGLRSNAVVHAVDGVDVSLRSGQVVALVGESGSGKSTIARLLARLIHADVGRDPAAR